VGTLDARLIALDGANGDPCPGFGQGGEIWLNQDVRLEESDWVNYTVTSPPVVVDDVLVVGSAIGDNRNVRSELGVVRGIDARTGAERWRWDPIPRDAADPAYAGWLSPEAANNGSGNAWAPLAADAELGLVYIPTGSASPDFYGGERGCRRAPLSYPTISRCATTSVQT
jgi:quinoprotein glucose dehydrogenase